MKRLCCTLVFIVLLTAGCGGWRSGVRSEPYVGAPPPERMPATKTVRLPGVQLDIELNNKIQTNDFASMLFVVPIHFDPREKPSFKETDKLTVKLAIIPAEPGFVFDPSHARVTIDGKEFSSISTSLFNHEKWRKDQSKKWDPSWLDDKEKMKAYWESLTFVAEDPNLYQDLVEKEVTLAEKKYYSFTIVFDTPVPTPDRGISLDIVLALRHPTLPAIPKINFMKVKWVMPYS